MVQALRDSTEDVWETEKAASFDGSLCLKLLQHHADKRFASISSTISSHNLLPLPLRIDDANGSPEVTQAAILERLKSCFQSVPPALKQTRYRKDEVSASENSSFKKNKIENGRKIDRKRNRHDR